MSTLADRSPWAKSTGVAAYWFAAKATAQSLHALLGSDLEWICAKHTRWHPGLSDIDFIVGLGDHLDSGAEYAAIETIWDAYFKLRKVFPMLCPPSEVKIFKRSRLLSHLKNQPSLYWTYQVYDWQPLARFENWKSLSIDLELQTPSSEISFEDRLASIEFKLNEVLATSAFQNPGQLLHSNPRALRAWSELQTTLPQLDGSPKAGSDVTTVHSAFLNAQARYSKFCLALGEPFHQKETDAPSSTRWLPESLSGVLKVAAEKQAQGQIAGWALRQTTSLWKGLTFDLLLHADGLEASEASFKWIYESAEKLKQDCVSVRIGTSATLTAAVKMKNPFCTLEPWITHARGITSSGWTSTLPDESPEKNAARIQDGLRRFEAEMLTKLASPHFFTSDPRARKWNHYLQILQHYRLAAKDWDGWKSRLREVRGNSIELIASDSIASSRSPKELFALARSQMAEIESSASHPAAEPKSGPNSDNVQKFGRTISS